jgi:transposase-like protein
MFGLGRGLFGANSSLCLAFALRLKDLMLCPYGCSHHGQKRGHYYRKVTKTYHQRYYCLSCRKAFSSRTRRSDYRHKRPDLLLPVLQGLVSSVSHRQLARNLGCSRLTIERKVRYLLTLAEAALLHQHPVTDTIYFDEMETIEHTKLKPLTIALAVSEDYKILSARVGRIPAKGKWAELSRKKYGDRENERDLTLKRMFQDLKGQGINPQIAHSDEALIYRKLVQKFFPEASHQTHKSRSQKEKRREALFQNKVKRTYDPMFPLNQRCALLRSSIKRLVRRSWCTTKDPKRLEEHLQIFIAFQRGLLES